MSKIDLPITFERTLPFDTGYQGQHNAKVPAQLVQQTPDEYVYEIDTRYMPRVRRDNGALMFFGDLQEKGNPTTSPSFTDEMLRDYLRESRLRLEVGEPLADQGRVELIAPDGVVLYTVDLAPLFRDVLLPFDIAVQLLNEKGSTFGLSLTLQDAPHEARLWQNTDLRDETDAACGDKYTSSMSIFTKEDPRVCNRALGHAGAHMEIQPGLLGYAEWQDGGAMTSPTARYAIQATCTECGLLTTSTHKHLCHTDDFWLAQMNDPKGALVIEGRHYRPGNGGFGGMIFNIQRHDGSTWRGELFTQGTIPMRWRNRIPDNATIVSTERPRR